MKNKFIHSFSFSFVETALFAQRLYVLMNAFVTACTVDGFEPGSTRSLCSILHQEQVDTTVTAAVGEAVSENKTTSLSHSQGNDKESELSPQCQGFADKTHKVLTKAAQS